MILIYQLILFAFEAAISYVTAIVILLSELKNNQKIIIYTGVYIYMYIYMYSVILAFKRHFIIKPDVELHLAVLRLIRLVASG